MKQLKKFGIYCLLIVGIILPTSSMAAWVDSQKHGDVVYFLFSAPNKIVRYNMVSKSFLEEIVLDKVPTAFTISGEKAYVGFHRELREINITNNSNQFIRNTSTDIKNIVVVGDYLYAAEQNSNVTSINTAGLGFVETRDSFYSGTAFVGSNQQSSYYYRTTGVSPSDIHKVTLAGDGTTLSDKDSQYHGDYPSASQLYINASESKVYDNAGIVYFSADLTYAGSLAGAVDTLTFIGDNPVALRGEQLFLYSAAGIEQGQISLNQIPDMIAGHEQTVFSFVVENSSVQTATVDISSFELPQPGASVDPEGLSYQPEFYAHDEIDILYLVDKESLSVFRWSSVQEAYLESWPLTNPPTWATFSVSHNRLYLGYSNGKITYFDASQTSPAETHFVSLASGMFGLLAAGDYLFAADASGAWESHHSFDVNGALIDSEEWRNTGAQYAWNSVTNRIYHQRDGTSPNDIEWTELDQSTGTFGADGDSPYHSGTLIVGYPILISDDGQYVLNGAGQILDAYSLTVLNSLSNGIADAAWVNGDLVSIKKGFPSLQFWDSNFELLSDFELSVAFKARVFEVNDQLLLVQEQASGPVFSIYDIANLPDTDGDGLHDLEDNCITELNADQLDNDGDDQGDVCDSDDDNDTLPDEVESAVGLNPLNSSDADGDLDGDGFNNRIEQMLGSDLNNASSKPSPLTNYSEGFENGWPAGFYGTSNTLGWMIHGGGAEGEHSFRSTYFTDSDLSSEVNFTSFFSKGVFSLQYKPIGSNGYSYDLQVIVDGVVMATRSDYSSDGDWKNISVTVEEGEHTITFKVVADYLWGYEQETYFLIDDLTFSPDSDGDGISDVADNCPNTSNRWQDDYDEDGIGDSCDSAPYVKDTDGDSDGVSDSGDNCPVVSNSEQLNLDGDGYGDVCDEDIDGDGVLNNIEQQYDFLNENDASDALADFDGDGIANRFEIDSGTSPEVADEHAHISLLDYHPLGDIEYIFSDDNYYYQMLMQRSDKGGSYLIEENSDGWVFHIERRTDGIFLTEYEYVAEESGLDFKYDYKNWLLLPSEMTLGEVVTAEGTINLIEKNQITASAVYQQSYQLVAVGEYEWQGKTYPSITLNYSSLDTETGDLYTEELVFLKGLGQIYPGEMELETVKFTSVDEQSLNNGGGGGSLSWFVFVIIGLFLRRDRLHISFLR